MAYDVILDTGSADLFLVSSSCTSSACSGLQTFSGSSSSTFNSTNQPFSITYGSGSASGVLVKDVVQMAGFQVSQQTFGMCLSTHPSSAWLIDEYPQATCNQVSSGLVSSPVSGIMGLGWQGLASSGATPFWQSLYQGNVWDEPLMAFYLTRFQNVSRAASEEPGGVFTMGMSTECHHRESPELIVHPSQAQPTPLSTPVRSTIKISNPSSRAPPRIGLSPSRT